MFFICFNRISVCHAYLYYAYDFATMREYDLDPQNYILGGRWSSNKTLEEFQSPKDLYESKTF